MKKILKIAKNELYSLFYSPIAWVLLIIYVVTFGMAYLAQLETYVQMSDLGGPSLRHVKNLTFQLSCGLNGGGFFFGIMGTLFVFFPLITMGLISKETSSGTMKLLLSSPLKIREIVLGKFVAMIGFTLVLLLLSIFVIIGLCFSIIHPDFEQLVTSLLGLLLVFCAHAAIGLFISALTSYQVVAAIITFTFLIFLGGIDTYWQNIDIIRDITYYLNISGRSNLLVAGFLNLRDIAYFIIVISSFIGFTLVKLKSGIELVSKGRVALRYIGIILIAFVLGYITNIPRFNMYYDATRNKIHTISAHTQEVLAGMNEGELKIDTYANLFDNRFYSFSPSAKNLLFATLWEQYLRFKPDIKINYHYYYNLDTASNLFKTEKGKSLKEIAEKWADIYKVPFSHFWAPGEARKHVDIDQEENRCFFVLTYKGKSTVLRVFDDQLVMPTENEVSAVVNRLIAKAPQISFITSEIERRPYSDRIRDYTLMTSELGNRHALINQGYDFDTISLDRQNIPPGLAGLVLADPRTAFSVESLEKIKKYIDEGGNLFITAEPDRKEISKPLLDKLGLSLRNGLLVQPSEQLSSDIVASYLTDTATQLTRILAKNTRERKMYDKDSLYPVAVAGASAIDYQEKDGFHITPLLYTDKTLAWNRSAPVDNDSLQLKITAHPGDEHGTFITSVLLNRTVNDKEQLIYVFSDADFITQPHLDSKNPQHPRYNYLFAFSCLSTFSYGKFPVNSERMESVDNAVRITRDDIGAQKMVFYWIIPAIIGILGSVILIRRKRK